jgi:hypothetical protein
VNESEVQIEIWSCFSLLFVNLAVFDEMSATRRFSDKIAVVVFEFWRRRVFGR